MKKKNTKDKDKNKFLKLRNYLEHTLSNKIKFATGNDLFDWLCIFILFGGGCVFIVFLIHKKFIGIYDGVAVFIFWFTALAIFKYTKETYWLKKLQQKILEETQKQTDFEMRPYLRLQWSNDSMRPRDVFEIINNGRGLAIDVKFDQFDIRCIKQVIRFSIKNRPLVSNMGGSIVSINELNETKKVIEGANINMESIKDYIETAGFSRGGFSITVKHKDIENHKYIAIFKSDESYNDKFRIEFQDLALKYKVKKSKN